MPKTVIKETVIRRLNENRKTWEDIAHATGVSFHSISKIARRVIPNPGIDNIEALYNYYELLDSSAGKNE